ncbi:hypothetical protein [Brevibacillus laterosporus]|uniref:hypothetical protein n=1 Tax=Brevibacillus laterosporus TaxID=1465 RepID=UPI000E6CD940|nr:hypothetical protein [Brevibacillus laterosporus]AYB37571.1 hypothetical protein D5F52_04355 [Brevibacillus laterosporus]MBM7111731.1 hypothetical protein [Brevibacillus laterosporus]
MSQVSARHLALLEGSKDQRDKYIGRVDILNRVKELSLLPDGEHSTLEKVAEYYNVDVEVIRKLSQRHREELSTDGLQVLSKESLSQFKKVISGHGVQIKARAYLTVIPRRAILRIGMLLTDSPVAEQVRTYLLNIEDQATKEQKNNAVNKLADWDTATDELLINTVTAFVHTDKTLGQAFQRVADLTGLTKSKIHARWYQNLKEKCDSKTLDLITNNRGFLFKKDEANQSKNLIDNNLMELKNWFEISMTHQIKEIAENISHKEAEWVSRNKELTSMLDAQRVEIEFLKKHLTQSEQTIEALQGSDKMKDELIAEKDKRFIKLSKEAKEMKKRIEAASLLFDTKSTVRELNGESEFKRPTKTFKMDKNGNLNKL